MPNIVETLLEIVRLQPPCKKQKLLNNNVKHIFCLHLKSELKSETQLNANVNVNVNANLHLHLTDNYTAELLNKRFLKYKEDYKNLNKIIKETNLPIRHQNPPEDITENIAKFIIQKYDNDPSCKWAKAINMKGDLYSEKYKYSQPEVKSFTSDGPSSFGPKKKFAVIYFLDMRKWLDDVFILWKVNLTDESLQWKKLKINKTETNEEQSEENRRPHISWDKIYPQVKDHTTKVYEGSFKDIFVENTSSAVV